MLDQLLALLLIALPLNPAPAVFHPLRREVSNWRFEAAWALDLPLFDAAGILVRTDPKGLSRCVRLNNYWCIKRAGWAGEIASDTEGHVAFSSTSEGALVAAVLLKRYYVDFKRHSAHDIVSRWAPAQCGGSVVAGVRRVSKPGNNAFSGTLRARWLAHRRGGAPLRRSVVADVPMPRLRAPAIAIGLGERDSVLPALNLANLPGISAGAPVGTCSGDVVRIANYARSASAGIAAENADLKLFGADGLPTGNLNRLMMNMAAVEIGPLHVRGELVDAAVTALTERLKAAQIAAEPHF